MVGTATRATDSYAEFVIVVTICCCSHEWVVFVSTSRAVVIVITVIFAIIGRTLVPVAPAAVIVGASGAGSPRSAMRMRRHFPGGTLRIATGELAEHGHAGSISTTSLTGTWSTTNGQGLSNSPDNRFSGIISGSNWSGNTHSGSNSNSTPMTITINASHGHNVSINAVGNSQKHENRPPYQVINRWKRIA